MKFMRLSQTMTERSSVGVVGLITSHGFLDNPTLRGMRWSLMQTFERIKVLDLHGNVSRKETCPDGSKDENVFDIKKTGVAISFFLRLNRYQSQVIESGNIWGLREAKYDWLTTSRLEEADFRGLAPTSPFFFLIYQDTNRKSEYESGYSVADILPLHSKGVVTGRDAFVTDHDKATLLARMADFIDESATDEELIHKYNLNPSDRWSVPNARKQMPPEQQHDEFVERLLYRPFDYRHCFYHPSVFMSPRRPVMQHFGKNMPNKLLITSRMTRGEDFAHVTVARGLAEAILLSSKTSNNAIIFPIYVYENTSTDCTLFQRPKRQSGFTEKFLDVFSQSLNLQVEFTGSGDFDETINVDDIFNYVFALLHSPTYRRRYREFLKRNFPRILLPGNASLTRDLCSIGAQLVILHLLEFRTPAEEPTRLIGDSTPVVEKASWADETIWFDKGKHNGLTNVSEQIWKFHLGGYQVCEKWLKDRQAKGARIRGQAAS